MALGMLLAIIDYRGVDPEEFNAWYDTEHIPEREGVPGVLRIQRWIGAEDPQLSLVLYDLESIEVLDSPEYRAVAGENYSPWSKRIFSRVASFDRYVGTQLSPGDVVSPGGAAALWTVRMNVAAVHRDEFNRWYDEEHLPALSTVPGVLAGRRFGAQSGPHGYFAIYHVEDPSIPSGEEWRGRAETPWTHEVRKTMTDRVRILFTPYEPGIVR